MLDFAGSRADLSASARRRSRRQSERLRTARVTTFVKACLAATLGLALGLWASRAILAAGPPFGVVEIGAWRVAVNAGSLQADPYTRAELERSGEIPLAVGEGLQLIARRDDAGRRLDPRCTYRVGPHTPAARYWTLSVVDRNGFPIENAAGRYGFRSSEILRQSDAAFSIYVSATAHSGNWLPVGAAKPFLLVLRLYDSPLSATAGGIEKSAVPLIERVGCA
ncbi:MAG: DUF1214 domain-containing protein [Hyphomicrobiales bacterium]|nr:DUF1214 domain-containing protein [Hyphomicrobiales bacterium]